ncbi:MAG: hypothetical protein ABW033_05955 [Acidimicrobiia bacterium]
MTTRRRTTRLTGATLVMALLAATTALLTPGSVATAASSNAITLTAGEYAYTVKGAPQPGWVQWNFANGGVEDHMMIVFPVKSGTTDKQVKAAAAKGEDAVSKLFTGDPVSGTPALVGPDQKTTTLTQVKAGTYLVACFVPAPDGEDHFAHGMFKVVTVKGSKSSFKPPTDGVADVTLTDTAIEVPDGAAPKQITLKVTNEGDAPHGFQLVKLETGKTLDDANTYFNAFFNTGTAEGTAPGVLVGGVSTVAPGGMAYLQWELPAGHYGYLSTDGDDPPDDDYTKGLKGEFDIS